MSQARLIEAQYSATDPDDFNQEIPKAKAIELSHAKLLPEFVPILQHGTISRFWRYLENRGFDDVLKLTKDYGLMCCQTGRWKDRIIIPVLDDREMVGWTARALQAPVNAPRYMTSGPSIKSTVFNGDVEGEILFIVEGPFDAIKLDYYGKEFGARAVCTFGTNVSPDQFGLLSQLKTHFNKTIILFDEGAIGPAFNIADWLTGSVIGQLPFGVKDPGELTKEQIRNLVNKV